MCSLRNKHCCQRSAGSGFTQNTDSPKMIPQKVWFLASTWENSTSDDSNSIECDEQSLFPANIPKKKKIKVSSKKVSFLDTLSVVLIPTIEDFRAANLHSDVWWRREEMRQFEHDMSKSVSEFMVKNSLVDLPTALKLYQDSGMIFEESNT